MMLFLYAIFRRLAVGKLNRLGQLPFAAMVLALLLVGCQAHLPRSASGIIRSYGTTRITSPLRDNGEVDYVAALVNRCGHGVTNENNALVLIYEALGPERLCRPDRENRAPLLGVRFNAEAKSLGSYKGPGFDYEDALWSPWTAEEYPEAAAWLATNRWSLDKLVEASRRPRFCVPLTESERHGSVASLPWYAVGQSGGRALLVRANRAIGEQRWPDAWRDVLAVYHLAELFPQCNVLDEYTAWPVSRSAFFPTVELVRSGNTSLLRELVSDLRALKASPPLARVCDTRQRFLLLDAIQEVARDPSLFGVKHPFGPDPAMRPEDVAQIDWNVVMRMVNRHFDEVVAAMSKPTARQTRKAFASMRLKRTEIERNAKNILAPNKSKLAGEQLLAYGTHDRELGWALAEDVSVRREVLVLAASLRLYYLAHGSYPNSLAVLRSAFLPQIPIDRFSDSAFIYRPTQHGFVLYSVGMNGIDDSGGRQLKGVDDIVITIGDSLQKE